MNVTHLFVAAFSRTGSIPAVSIVLNIAHGCLQPNIIGFFIHSQAFVTNRGDGFSLFKRIYSTAATT